MRIVVTNSLFAAAGATLTAGAMLLCTPASAHAADVLTRQANVSYADLDLTVAAGRTTLQSRIHQAASAVCTPQGDDVSARLASAACRKQAIAEAAHRMDMAIAAASTKRVALR